MIPGGTFSPGLPVLFTGDPYQMPKYEGNLDSDGNYQRQQFCKGRIRTRGQHQLQERVRDGHHFVLHVGLSDFAQ